MRDSAALPAHLGDVVRDLGRFFLAKKEVFKMMKRKRLSSETEDD